jgi:hypothetical protein
VVDLFTNRVRNEVDKHPVVYPGDNPGGFVSD